MRQPREEPGSEPHAIFCVDRSRDDLVRVITRGRDTAGHVAPVNAVLPELLAFDDLRCSCLA